MDSGIFANGFEELTGEFEVFHKKSAVPIEFCHGVHFQSLQLFDVVCHFDRL